MTHTSGSIEAGVRAVVRFDGGIEVDLTWEQFRDDDRIIDQCRTLAARVAAALSAGASRRPRR